MYQWFAYAIRLFSDKNPPVGYTAQPGHDVHVQMGGMAGSNVYVYVNKFNKAGCMTLAHLNINITQD